MSPARMISYKLLNIRLLFMFCQLLIATAKNCGSESSVHGKMHRDYALKTLKTRDPMDCLQECHTSVLCQSINYSILNGICDLNNRLREARPEAFVADMDHIYIKRWSKRGTCQQLWEHQPAKRTSNLAKMNSNLPVFIIFPQFPQVPLPSCPRGPAARSSAVKGHRQPPVPIGCILLSRRVKQVWFTVT